MTWKSICACHPCDARTKLNLLRCSGNMQTGGVRVFYGVSAISRRCSGEGVARTRTVTVRLPYDYRTITIRLPYGACASTVQTHTCLRTPVEFYDHCTWPVRVPVMAVSAHTGSWPRTTAYVPSTGEKKMCMHNFQTRAANGYKGSIRAETKPVELRAGPYSMPYDHPRVTGIWPLRCP